MFATEKTAHIYSIQIKSNKQEIYFKISYYETFTHRHIYNEFINVGTHC